MMKQRIVCCAAMLVVGAGAVSALADGRVTVTDATGDYNGSDGSGGAFTVTRSTPQANGDFNGIYGDNRRLGDGRADTSFLSFCLEVTEHLSFGSTYYTQIATSAANGGAGGGNPDPLSSTTALLYHEFRNMVSDASVGSVATGGRFNGLLGAVLTSAETTAIQQAIWYSENEIGSISGDALAIYNWANTNNDGSLYNVRVLRLWTGWTAQGGYSGNSQDLLTIVPLPPAAWAGIASLSGIGIFGIIRRRKQLA